MRRHLTAVVLSLVLPAAAAWALELYVAPDGKDDNPGTRQQPLATLPAARDTIRALRARGALPPGGVTVLLRGGVYYLAESFELARQDSGTAAAPVTYRAYGKEQAWLSGGKPLAANLLHAVTDPAVLGKLDPAARGRVLEADLTAAGVPRDVETLPDAFRGFTNNHPVLAEVFCDGRRLQLARWPNSGFGHFSDIVDTGSGLLDPKGEKRPGRFRIDDERVRRWNVEDGVWINGYWARAYLCETVRIGKIDNEKQELEWAVPLGYGLDTRGAKRIEALNMLCELDTPGEYCLDRRSWRLYLWPPAAGAGRGALGQRRVVVSVLATPLVNLTECDYVNFRGLGLENGRQSGLNLTNCSHNRVTACTIHDLGMDGVVVAGGVDVGVAGCDIYNMGYGGIRLSGGDRATLTPCNHFADNNHIHHTSVIRRTHAGPISLKGVGLRAAHNLLHHEPHTAVWYSGNDIVMEYNEIYSVLTDTTEGGVFYTGYDWTYRGNVIRGNYIHHINDTMEGCGSEAVVVHEDDCASGTSFTGNLCYLTGSGAVMCGGPDNTADNNLFVNCKTGAIIEGRGLSWWTWTKHPDGTVTVVDTRNGATMNNLLRSLQKVPYREGPWLKYPHLADMLERDPAGAPYFCEVTRNIAVGGKAVVVERNVKPEWVTVKDNWDNEGDPGFVKPPTGLARPADFRLRADAPALHKLGFRPLELERMGLVNDGTRASWPAQAEPPPPGFKPRWLLLKEQQLQAPSALPVARACRAYGTIRIDGSVEAEEWCPARAQAEPYAATTPLPLAFNYDGKAAPWPSKAWLQVDDRNLYVAFLSEVDPARGVSGGQVWGKDDAVEIAIAPVSDRKVGDILIWRGYSNGAFTTSDEAGTPAPRVRSALQGVSYACKAVAPGSWTAEWKIPFTAIGVVPRNQSPRLLFNLSVRKPAGDLWVMFKKTGGFTWEVRNGGVLWLEPFGDLTLSGAIPSQPLCYLAPVTPGMLLKPLSGCVAPEWAKPTGSRLLANGDNLTEQWRDFSFSFSADRDGEAALQLCGAGYQNPVAGGLAPVWTYYDAVAAEGAELRNGGFERIEQGAPLGWALGGLLVAAPGVAAEGTRCVKAWHDGRVVQNLKVTAGQTVTVRMRVRGEGAR